MPSYILKKILVSPFLNIPSFCCFYAADFNFIGLDNWSEPVIFYFDMFSVSLHERFLTIYQDTCSCVVFQALITRDTFFMFKFILLLILKSSLLADTNSPIPYDKVMYSASSIDNEISNWSLDYHNIGTVPKISSTHVLLFTLIGTGLSSNVNSPEKSVSTNKSSRRVFLSGYIIRLFVLAPFRSSYLFDHCFMNLPWVMWKSRKLVNCIIYVWTCTSS